MILNKPMHWLLIQVLQLLLLSTLLIAPAPPDKCTVCDRLATAFADGVRRTAKDNFGGGNTHWEESRLGSYAHSETRLLDIQERICQDESKDDSPICHALLEQLEESLEAWWFGDFRKGTEASAAALRGLLCVSKAALCCAHGTFGPQCAPCPACSPIGGSCEGNGTRGGSGKCQCQTGYSGDLCELCAPGYFKSADGGVCAPCHPACGPSGCSQMGPADCIRDCAPGYSPQPKDGAEPDPSPSAASEARVTCVDIDECAAPASPDKPAPCAGPHERCVNSPGSFACDCESGHRRAESGDRQCEPEPLPEAAEAGDKSADAGDKSADAGDESTGAEIAETTDEQKENGESPTERQEL